jgi:hypothetical protein
MALRYRTPEELVEALQGRAPGGRAQLRELLYEPLARLMDGLRARHALDEDRDLLARHALHAAETYLRTRPLGAFTGMSWGAFRGAVLLQVGKLALEPYGGQPGSAGGPQPLPESALYHCQTYFLPYQRLGRHAFGGDWFGGLQADDGSLWVILADITGHGYHAYLLACGLPGVWQHSWTALGSPAPQPAEVLAAMHHLLADCLPDGVFLECTLARLGPDGAVTVVPAGGTRLLLRRGRSDRADLLKLRGTWLGLMPPCPADQHCWVLAQGDELLLATDGVFDQLEEHLGAEAVPLPEQGNLFEAVQALLEQALAQLPQRDDLTMVLLRRAGPGAAGEHRHNGGVAAARGAGDVPV